MARKLAIFFTVNLTLFLAFNSGSSLFAQTKGNLSLNELLSDYGIEFKKGGSSLVLKDFSFIAQDKYFRNIVTQEGKNRIDMEIIKPLNEEEASKHMAVKYAIIKNLYGPQMIPYQGTITTTTDCPAEKKPKEKKVVITGKKRLVLLVNATERYTLGVWDDTLIKQKAAFTVFYDQGMSTLYRVTIFQPANSFNRQAVFEILRSIEINPKK